MDCARTRPVECALRRPAGAERRVICQLAWRDLAPGSDVWSFEDVTQLRAVELELLRTSQDLQRANREAASLREELRAEREGREELLAVVSHELRTPVTVIGGYSRLLLSGDAGPVTDEQRRFLLESAKSCQRLNEFIGKLFEASREKKGGEVLELGSHALAPVVEAVRELLLPLAAERDIQILVRIDPAAGIARFDPLRVEQILTNLIGNAIQHARPQGDHRDHDARAADADGRPPLRRGLRRGRRSGRRRGAPGTDLPALGPGRARAGARAASGSGSRSAGGWSRRTAARSRCAERPGGGCRFGFTLPAADAARRASER